MHAPIYLGNIFAMMLLYYGIWTQLTSEKPMLIIQCQLMMHNIGIKHKESGI